jgi:ribonuclease BN (tRNA processing enzyme)
LVSFARGTDILLIEATLPRPERTGVRGHLTPEEAGEHGRRALARRLVLTHYSDELDAEWARAQAGHAFGDDVELAQEGAVYTV